LLTLHNAGRLRCSQRVLVLQCTVGMTVVIQAAWTGSRGAGDRQGQGGRGRLTPEGHEGWSTVCRGLGGTRL